MINNQQVHSCIQSIALIIVIIASLIISVHPYSVTASSYGTLTELEIENQADGGTSEAEKLFSIYAENEFAKEIVNTHKTYSNNSVSIKAEQVSSKRGDKLTGLNKIIYDELEENIIYAASGIKWHTDFTIDLSGKIKLKYTAKDLGVQSVGDDDGINETARKALGKKLNYNMELVVNALLTDHPYELYWFDKTKNIVSNWYKNGSVSLPLTLWKDRDDQDILELDDSMELYFPVVREYAEGTYCIDRSTGQSVQNAVNNAKKIREKYKDASDKNKLAGYCIEICKLTSYNNNPEKYYGNAWQLIWVFDNNPLTNVQCEGYAKAFQYLCDITSFENSISCITTTGKLSSGSSKTNHMWNILHMENGKNYLADITNCDGCSNYFLSGCISGNVSKGYTYKNNGRNYLYTYDKETFSLYKNAELIMAASSYGIITKTGPTKVNGLTLSGISHNIAAGKKIKLTASIKPTTASNKTISWKSSNKKIATVTSTGTVKVKKKAGGRSVTITATTKDGTNIKKSWKIKVMKGTVKSIKIKGAPTTLQAGKSMNLKVKVKASKKANKTVHWISSNSKYAAVTQTGIVTAKTEGKGKTVVITARATDGSGKKKSVTIMIK